MLDILLKQGLIFYVLYRLLGNSLNYKLDYRTYIPSRWLDSTWSIMFVTLLSFPQTLHLKACSRQLNPQDSIQLVSLEDELAFRGRSDLLLNFKNGCRFIIPCIFKAQVAELLRNYVYLKHKLQNYQETMSTTGEDPKLTCGSSLLSQTLHS